MTIGLCIAYLKARLLSYCPTLQAFVLPGQMLHKSTDHLVDCGGQVLKTVAQTHKPEARRRFYQLRIMDFLVRELSLEHEVQQYSRLPPALAAAAVAGWPKTPKDEAQAFAASQFEPGQSPME